MVHNLKLSKRLSTVASYIPKGSFFADIGSDHAYLPCYVCISDSTTNAIAGEVNEGPFNSALETVNSLQLSEAIEVRLGNGLQVLRVDEVQQVVIAGMGGSLIRSILEDGKSKLKKVTRIIVQPNIDARTVRKWFADHNFQISKEEILEENGHIYEIIVADRSDNDEINITDKQLLFGPLLLREKSAIFYKKWRHESDKLFHVINQMKKATIQNEEKINRFEMELEWMKEVLDDEAFNS